MKRLSRLLLVGLLMVPSSLIYASDGDIEFECSGVTCTSNNFNWDDTNEFLRVTRGVSSSMLYPYESAVFEHDGDNKLGIYDSNPYAGFEGASLLMGYSGRANDDGYYDGYEFQMLGVRSGGSTSNFRLNYVQRDTTSGGVVGAIPDIWQVSTDDGGSANIVFNSSTFQINAPDGISFYTGETVNFLSYDTEFTGGFRIPVEFGTSMFSCNGSNEGRIYFNDQDNHFMGCDGTDWVQLDNGDNTTENMVSYEDWILVNMVYVFVAVLLLLGLLFSPFKRK